MARPWLRSSEVRRLEGGRGLVGEDREELEVVAVELAEPELGQRDDPDHPLVVAHRHHEHRFVHVVGARDRLAARVGVGVVHQQRDAMLGDPAGEALAEPAAEQVEVHVLVGADPALEGDRHDLVGPLHHVDPGVVVVDDAAGLLDHGPADLLDRGRPAHPRRGGLEDGEMGGPLLDAARAEPGGEQDRAEQREGRVGPPVVGEGPAVLGEPQRGSDAEQDRAAHEPGVRDPADGLRETAPLEGRAHAGDRAGGGIEQPAGRGRRHGRRCASRPAALVTQGPVRVRAHVGPMVPSGWTR